MKRVETIRFAVIVALLLPGLAMAAPIAGPCGLCGDGESCRMRQPVQQEADAHSCCERSSEKATPASSLGSTTCECGRQAPPALTADAPAPIEAGSVAAVTRETISASPQGAWVYSHSTRPPAPPPAPPAFLIDCAFLT